MMYRRHITLPANAHILVVKLAGIGDLLLATPALRALRETYPQGRIDLLVTPDSAGLLNGWEVIDHVIVLNKYLFDYPQQVLKNPRSLQRLAPLWRELRAGDYDAVLLLHHLTLPFGRLKHQLLMRATGAKWRAGLDNGHGRGWFLNVRVKDAGFGAMHEAEYNLAVARAVGATTKDRHLTVPLSESNYAQARQLLYEEEASAGAERPIIALHGDSSGIRAGLSLRGQRLCACTRSRGGWDSRGRHLRADQPQGMGAIYRRSARTIRRGGTPGPALHAVFLSRPRSRYTPGLCYARLPGVARR